MYVIIPLSLHASYMGRYKTSMGVTNIDKSLPFSFSIYFSAFALVLNAPSILFHNKTFYNKLYKTIS